MLTRSRRKNLLESGTSEENVRLYTLEDRVMVKNSVIEFSVFETLAVLTCLLFLLMVFVKTDWFIPFHQYDYNYRIFRKAWI